MSKKCANCGAELPEGALFCHRCESSQIRPKTPRAPRVIKKKWFPAAAVVLLAAAAALLCFLPRNPAAGDPAELSPAPAQTPAPAATVPAVRYLSATEAFFTDAEGSYRVCATFQQNGSDDPGGAHFSADCGRLESLSKPNFIYVFRADTGQPAKEEFYIKIRSAQVLLGEPGDPDPAMSIPAVKCQMDGVVLEAMIPYAFDTGEKELRWQIELTNGVVLEFTQTMSITPREQAFYNADNTALDTMDDLRALVARIEAEVSPETEVIIELPGVRYSGVLELNRSYNIVGSSAEGAERPVFTDTVICRASMGTIVSFFNVDFIGSGGTGVEDHGGVFLQNCTLRGWDVAAATGEIGWVGVGGCTIEDNGIGLQYNTSSYWYNHDVYADNIFRGNGTAIEINSMPKSNSLTFPGTIFVDNETNIVNRTGQPLGLLPENFQ